MKENWFMKNKPSEVFTTDLVNFKIIVIYKFRVKFTSAYVV